jgi:hypothetical protein
MRRLGKSDDTVKAIETVTDKLANQIFELEGESKDFIVEYQNKLGIDRFDLQTICAEHPQYYSDVALFSSKITGVVTAAELNVKELKAETSTRIRSERETAGLKTSEAMILELIDTDTAVKEARRVRLSAYQLRDISVALLNAYEHRRSMINNEVQLFLSERPDVGNRKASEHLKSHYNKG